MNAPRVVLAKAIGQPIALDSTPVRADEPTEAQAKSGNYAKRVLPWKGLTIRIENEAGSVRRGTDPTGQAWESHMALPYGYFVESMGVDGDPVDVYVGPFAETAEQVFIVHQRQVGDWKKYDEDKVFIGMLDEASVRDAFLQCYDDERFLGPITAMPVSEFVEKVRATRKAPKMIKARVGPYIRLGKLVNIHGYEGKAGRAEKAPGQADLFTEGEVREAARRAAPVKQTETQQFREWFGSSKVRDENGEPMRMYHITPHDFDTFHPGGKEVLDGHVEGQSGRAIWFSPFKEDQPAAHNTHPGLKARREGVKYRDGTNVMPVYLRIERPLMIDDKTMLEWARHAFAGGSSEFPQIVLGKWKDEIVKEGYDGIIFRGDALGWGEKDVEYIVFDPHQIKSAIGNNGDFSKDSPVITKSLPVVFLKAKHRGDDRTVDMFAPAVTHVETHVRKDGVVQKYHVSMEKVQAIHEKHQLAEKRDMLNDFLSARPDSPNADDWRKKIAEIDAQIGPKKVEKKEGRKEPDMSGWSDHQKAAYALRREYEDGLMYGSSKEIGEFKRKIRRVAKTIPENDEKAVLQIDNLVTRVWGTNFDPKRADVEFAKPATVTESRAELVKEHERLVQVLESPSHADDKAEAKRQKKELEEYKAGGDAPKVTKVEAVKPAEPSKAMQTRARRQAVLDVLGEGWKAQAGVDGARDAYKKVVTRPDGGKVQLLIMPEKTVDGNFYVGSYNVGGSRPGAGSNGSAKTIEEAKAMAEKFAGGAAPADDPETDLRAMWSEQGVPKERQDELIRQIGAKAAPGAKVGPFEVQPAENLENFIKVAADSIEQLRRVDVLRVLESNGSRMVQLANYITDKRPDLAKEVAECMEDIGVKNWRAAPAPAPVTVSSKKRVKDPLEGTQTHVSLSNGKTHRIQRLNSTESMGLPGWHDVEGGYLADNEQGAIDELVRRAGKAAPDARLDMVRYLGGDRDKDIRDLARFIDEYGYSDSNTPEYRQVRNAAAAVSHLFSTGRLSGTPALEAMKRYQGDKARNLLADIAKVGANGSMQDMIDAFYAVIRHAPMVKSIQRFE